MAEFERLDDENYYFKYNRVSGFILSEYVTPDLIDAYLEDEVFWDTVKDSYKNIDLSGRNQKDMERFLRKREKTADWIRKSVKALYD